MNSDEIKAWQGRVDEHPSISQVQAADNQTIAILEVALQLALINERSPEAKLWPIGDGGKILADGDLPPSRH